jgi:mRNA interferase MazF
MEVRRGELVTIALSGDYGKPRPALVIQSDFFDAHPSVTVLPVTSDLRDAPFFRVTVQPAEMNGLRKPSQIMIDKAVTIARANVGARLGSLDDDVILEVSRRLAIFLGIAK